jgi:hypothetical protein
MNEKYEWTAWFSLIGGALFFVLRYIPFLQYNDSRISLTAGMKVCAYEEGNPFMELFLSKPDFCNLLPLINVIIWIVVGFLCLIAIYSLIKGVCAPKTADREIIKVDKNSKKKVSESSSKNSFLEWVSSIDWLIILGLIVLIAVVVWLFLF